MAKKEDKIATTLLIIALIVLVYYLFLSQFVEDILGNNGGNGGNGGGQDGLCPTCCTATGLKVIPPDFPTCTCPDTAYNYNDQTNSCELNGIVGCMDTNASNFMPSATIPDNSCNYLLVPNLGHLAQTPIVNTPPIVNTLPIVNTPPLTPRVL